MASQTWTVYLMKDMETLTVEAASYATVRSSV